MRALRRRQDPTREHLLEAAKHVFANRGFQGATVREICTRAHANIAAVNYHFGDKRGLYSEVLRQAIPGTGPKLDEPASETKVDPEKMLRNLIAGMARNLSDSSAQTWQLQLLAHEIAQPSLPIGRLVRDALGPAYDRMRSIVARILALPASDERTSLCTYSILGQVMFFMRMAHFKILPMRRERIADHIADFSLAYLRLTRGRRRTLTSSGEGGPNT